MKNTFSVTLPTDREVVMTRLLNAPREMVWKALTQPEIIKRWLYGPPGWEMTLCQEDTRVGGSFRWEWKGPEGASMAMKGTYREINPPERIVRTESFEFGCEAHSGEQLATLILSEWEGKTTVTISVLYPSKEARDAAVATGMVQGVEAGYERLDQLLAQS